MHAVPGRSLRTSILAVCAGLLGSRAVPAAPGTAIGVVVHGEPPADRAGQQLRQAVRQALQTHPAFSTIAPALETRLFATPPSPEPGPALTATRKALEAAASFLQAFELGPARRALRTAGRTLATVRLLDEAAPLDRLRLELLVALAHLNRDEEGMEQHLLEYGSRFRSAEPQSSLWPPDLVQRLSTTTSETTTRLHIDSTPAGQVRVNGVSVGSTPLTLDIARGQHRVEVRAPGHVPARAWAKTETAKPTHVRLELGTDLAVPLARSEKLNVELIDRLSELARRNSLDNLVATSRLPTGQIRLQLIMIPPSGSARLMPPFIARNRPADLETVVSQLAVQRSEFLASSQHRPSSLVWIGLASGAALAAAGITLRFLAQERQDEFRARLGALTQTEAFDLRDEADRRATAGNILIGVGAATFAGFASWAAVELWGDD